MLCRGRLHRVGGAVNAPPSPIGRPRKAFKTKLAWGGASATSAASAASAAIAASAASAAVAANPANDVWRSHCDVWWSSGDPEKLSKPSWRRGGAVRAAPKPDCRCDWFRRAWNDVVAPPCILHCTPLASNAGDSQAKCVPNGGWGWGAGFGRPQNQSAGPFGFGVPGMMLWHRRACFGLRPRCVPHRLACSGPKMDPK
jgi:hypothetical protein